ncbi:MAG: Ku protein [Pseudomonadota bacterium]
MPRSNWKGYISFGLVSIPIVLYTSQNKSADISFHQIDKRNNARIKYQRVNSVTGKAVEWGDIIKGYEYDKETMVPVPEDVLTKVAGENARTIAIENFINKKDFDMLTIDRSYYLVPDKKGLKGYVILREALASTGKIGIAKVIISTKEYVAAVMPYEDKALVMYLLKYDNEMRKMPELEIPTKDIATYKVNKKEIDIAKKLIDSMSAKWKPEEYVDEYQEALHEWVEEAATKKPHRGAMKARAHAQSNVVNFVDLLKKSLEGKGKKSKVGAKSKATSHRAIPKPKSKQARYASKH